MLETKKTQKFSQGWKVQEEKSRRKMERGSLMKTQSLRVRKARKKRRKRRKAKRKSLRAIVRRSIRKLR